MNRMLCSVLLSGAIMGAGAQTLTFVDGATDWSLASSYSENVAPQAGDTVMIPSGVCAKVDDSNLDSWNAFAAMDSILFNAKSSSLEITVGETAGVPNEREAACVVHYKSTSNSSYLGYGKVIKKGVGKVTFTRKIQTVLWTPIEVVEGTLALPQDFASTDSSKCACGTITVRENGIFMPSRPADGSSIKYGVTTTPGIWGQGVISNSCSGQRLNVIANRGVWSEFEGRIYNVRWNSAGNVRLLGTNNVFRTTMTAIGGTTAFKKIGKKSETNNSIGSMNLYHNGNSSFLYLGDTADETDRSITLQDTTSSSFDAGHHGEITLTGTLTPDDDEYPKDLRRYSFTGSNAVESVMAGSIVDVFYANAANRLTIVKSGTGTWKFTDNADRTWGGELDVEDGTLKCTSLAEPGTVCSLGTATNKPNDYAWKFGAADSIGRLEYIGEKHAVVTGRTSVVTGLGGGIVNSSAGRFIYAAGVRPLGTETNAFIVGGASTKDNVITRLSDGEGRLSLVKEGNGSWTLDGTNDISGSIDVRGGTLYVRDTTKYSWVRFVVKGTFDNSATDLNIKVKELGLWDGDGARINANLAYFTNYHSYASVALPAGQFGYDQTGAIRTKLTTSYYYPESLFDDASSGAIIFNGGRKILYSDPSSYVPVVMHLAFGKKGPGQFDMAHYERTANRQVKSFAIEGSVDGVNWSDITADQSGDQIREAMSTANVWAYRGTSPSYGKLATHVNGLALLPGPANATPALDRVTSVSVASGARLVCENTAVVIHGLSVLTAGAGTIENASFAATGVLEIPDLPNEAATLPITFTGCAGVDNLKAWTVTKDGKNTKRTVSINAAGQVTIVPAGMIFFVR